MPLGDEVGTLSLAPALSLLPVLASLGPAESRAGAHAGAARCLAVHLQEVEACWHPQRPGQSQIQDAQPLLPAGQVPMPAPLPGVQPSLLAQQVGTPGCPGEVTKGCPHPTALPCPGLGAPPMLQTLFFSRAWP